MRSSKKWRQTTSTKLTNLQLFTINCHKWGCMIEKFKDNWKSAQAVKYLVSRRVTQSLSSKNLVVQDLWLVGKLRGKKSHQLYLCNACRNPIFRPLSKRQTRHYKKKLFGSLVTKFTRQRYALTHSYLFIPIYSEGRIVSFLQIGDRKNNDFLSQNRKITNFFYKIYNRQLRFVP